MKSLTGVRRSRLLLVGLGGGGYHLPRDRVEHDTPLKALEDPNGGIQEDRGSEFELFLGGRDLAAFDDECFPVLDGVVNLA